MNNYLSKFFSAFIFMLTLFTGIPTFGQEKLEFRGFNKGDNRVGNAVQGAAGGGLGAAAGAGFGLLVAGPFGAAAGAIIGAVSGGGAGIGSGIEKDEKYFEELKRTMVPSKITFEHIYSDPKPEVWEAYKRYSTGKAALVIFRSPFYINTETAALLDILKKGRPALRTEFGRPVRNVDGVAVFTVLTNPALKAAHEQAIANTSEEFNRLMLNRLRQSVALSPLKQLAVLSSAPPHNSFFEDALCEHISDIVMPQLWAYVTPKQEDLTCEHEQKQKVQADATRFEGLYKTYVSLHDTYKGLLETANKNLAQMHEQKQKNQQEKNLLSTELETLQAGTFQAIEQLDRLEEENEELPRLREENQKYAEQLEALQKKRAQESEQAAKDYAAVYRRSEQLSPTRHRAEHAERQSEEKDAKNRELEKQNQELRRKLEEAQGKPSYASVVRGDHLQHQ